MISPAAFAGMPIPEFVATSPDEILGRLTAASKHDVERSQRDAWQATIAILQDALADIPGYVYLEFDVPRLGSRIDAVVITGPAIVPVEFKVGEHDCQRDAINQVWDYALDLKNFHLASRGAPIFPILVPTEVGAISQQWKTAAADGVYPPACCNSDGIPELIRGARALATGNDIDPVAWGSAPYHPTPTIVEAARALFSRHSVEAIARSDASAQNLAVTSARVEEIIERARQMSKKAIVFVTGVPGAGKTLVGLNIATEKRDTTTETHAVFLSGNGPLVAVLREALIRDDFERRKALGERVRKGVIGQPVKQFIQNVHHFRDDGVRDSVNPPSDHVAIFDEAQRAWNRQATANFMQRRKGHAGFDQSEAEFLIGYMNRRPDWAVIVCLAGC
ncbi:MAG: DNA/RNA helicase domain-containing protein [Gemmatimonadales bacterium]